ncbi:8-oxoguanine deaminase, partial [Candidatus Bipolaricaulota bacterium]|nr:8-oxoguanine deaminase [Candidatus Bipolaricaulota bacterium]
MKRTLFVDFDVVATMDAAGREIPGGFVLVEGSRILAVGDDATGIKADDVVQG